MTARILIIENHPANLKLMAYLLNTWGYEVVTASAGEEGLRIARQNQLDLIVCDIRMPGMDGFELARRLRSDPNWRRVPLVAATALALAGDREKVLAGGFDGYIAKAIAPKLFIEQIQSFLPASESTSTVIEPPQT